LAAELVLPDLYQTDHLMPQAPVLDYQFNEGLAASEKNRKVGLKQDRAVFKPGKFSKPFNGFIRILFQNQHKNLVNLSGG
jgi:hypothetical protein